MNASTTVPTTRDWELTHIAAPRSGTALFAITFLLIYGPRIFGSFALDVISLVSLAVVASAAWGAARRVVWVRGSGLPAIVLFLLCCYALLIGLLTGYQELFYPAKFLRALLNYAAIYVLCGWYRSRYGPAAVYVILTHVFYAVALHSGIMLVQFFSSEAARVIVMISGHDRAKIYRVTGLTESYNTLSIVQGTGFMIGTLLHTRLRSFGPPGLFYPGLALIFVSLFLAGRTAAFVMLVLTALGLLIGARRHLLNRHLLVGLLGLSVSVAVILLLAPQSVIDKFTDYTLAPLIGLIDAYRGSGTVQGTYAMQTAEVVFGRMYFLPDDPVTLWFGSSLSGRGDIYIPSDVGYVLFIFGIGIAGLTSVVLFYLYLIRVAFEWRRFDPWIGYIAAALAIGIMIVHAKEQTLLTRHAFSVSMLLLCPWYYLRNDLRSAGWGRPS